MRKARVLFVLALVAVLWVGIAGDAPSEAGAELRVEVYANRGPQRTDLTQLIVDLIRDVPEGGTIDVMVAWFTETKRVLAEELLSATEENDVQVRVLVRHEDDCAWLLGMGLDARRLTTHHHKVVVFPDAVLTGSANWSPTSLESDWNDIVVIYNQDIRNFYHALFEDAWVSMRSFPCR